MSEKRRDDGWTGGTSRRAERRGKAERNDDVACGLPKEGTVTSAAPERIDNM
jgi:hypothetical protein